MTGPESTSPEAPGLTHSAPVVATSRLALVSSPARTDPFGRPRRRGVAIIGFTDHRLQAPLNDPDFELWGLNELYRYMDPKLFTRWFEIHPRDWFEKDGPNGDPEHMKGLATAVGHIPCYMHHHHNDIPNSVPFPKAEVEASLGQTGRYMTSSIAWMIGLALYEGFEEIRVYGVDMAQDTEYFEQRACCEHLLGIAIGRGVTVFIPPTSDLLKAVGQYGWSDENPLRLKIEERLVWLQREQSANQQKGAALDKEFNTKSEMLNTEYNQKKDAILSTIHQIQGAIDDCTYWRRSWTAPAEGRPGAKVTPDRNIPKLGAIESAPAGDGR